MDKNTPLTFGLFEDYFVTYMDKFQEYLEGRFQKIDDRFDSLEEQIGNLAFATKTGFDDMDRQFTDVKQEIHIVQNDMTVAKKYIQASSIESSSNRVRLQNLEAHIA